MSETKLAVVFDMDGVLVDSVSLNWQAMNEALAPYGANVKDDQIVHYLGKSLEDQVLQLNNELGLELGYADFEGSTTQIKARLFERLQPKEGVTELLTELDADEIPRAVATSTPGKVTRSRLGNAGILQYFHATVAAEDVVHHKPHPDVYLKAAELLGVVPMNCVAFEDAPSGIRAARSAGMKCIAIKTIYTTTHYLREADLIVASLREVDLSLIKSVRQGKRR